MNSALYLGFVQHLRHVPRRHLFRYRTAYWYLDLEELPELDRRLYLFGVNRTRLFSFYERDFLDGHGPVRTRLDAFLDHAGIDRTRIHRWCLLTHVRQWGYVFNPVSFFYGLEPNGQLACVVAEVNNTFGERFHYALPCSASSRPGGSLSLRAVKEMHVSPFTRREGASYEFRLRLPAEQLRIAIRLYENDVPTIDAAVWALRRPLTDGQLFRLLLRHPWLTGKVIAAIHFEALKLYRKGLHFFSQPKPSLGQERQAELWRRVAWTAQRHHEPPQ